MNRDVWLAKRREVITATDIGAICGLSPYRSMFDIWMMKTSDYVENEPNSAMSWGNRLEPVIAEAYTEKYGVQVSKAEFIRKDIDGVPCGCTQDYVSIDKKINVEIKTSSSSSGWGETGTDQVPDYYLTQVTWQMGLAGQKMTHLAVLIGSRDFRIYNVPYDQLFFDSLFERAKTFWELVKSKTPPPVDGSVSCRQYYSTLYKKGSKDLIPNPSQICVSNSVKLFKLQRLLNIIETKKEEITNSIIKEVGEYGGIAVDGLGKLSIVRSSGRESVSYKAVVDALKPSVPVELMESVIAANTKTSEPSTSVKIYPKKD